MDRSIADAEQRVGGTVAGKYRLLRLLGAGGMGAVYEAEHEFTQRRVALKLMHAGFARSKLASERFLREARAPSSIGHPGVVEVLDGGRDEDGSPYLVLELLEGETLGDALRAGSLTPRLLGNVAFELLDALAAMHEAGFVHRDIKPDNVFLVPADADDHPSVKLLDFGIASITTDSSSPSLTVAGSVLGTPHYMSPEQALGRKVDARSDLWSVGAVMYQALSGKPPFAGDSMHALIISISTQEHLPLSARRPDLPIRLAAVVERALQKNPDQRWQSAEDMADALRQALAHGERTADGALRVEPPPAAIAATESPLQTQSTGPSWSGTVVLALVVALMGALGAVWWSRSHPAARSSAEASLPTRRADDLRDQPAPSSEPKAPAQARADLARAPVAPEPKATSPEKPAPQPKAPDAPAKPAAKPLDANALSNVLEAHQGELQRCYENAVVASLGTPGAAQDALARVRLDVAIALAASGKIDRVALTGEAPDELKACVSQAISGFQLPASDRPSDLTFPVVFQREVVQR
ncbi:MAG: serine/threonine-protein kinase [Polyangiales bacterium]